MPLTQEYKLNINEAMMFAIQAATGHASSKIIAYFYDIATKQRLIIERSPQEVKDKKRRHEIYSTKSYGFYPETKIYFVVGVQKEHFDNQNNFVHSYYGQTGSLRSYRQIDKIVWTATVNPPRKMLVLDNKQIDNAIAEGLLIGDEGMDLNSPDKLRSNKFSVESLFGTDEPLTDPKIEGQED